jgi:hypothetical protein
MGILTLATSRHTRNPVRVQQWNASIRAGDDFKLALTVYADDAGTPVNAVGSQSQLIIRPDQERGYYCTPDYGLGWFTGGSLIGSAISPTQIITGVVVGISAPGQINFAMASTITASLRRGRYRLALQVDLPDGDWTQIEGILQVREFWMRVPILPVLGEFSSSDFGTDFNVGQT